MKAQNEISINLEETTNELIRQLVAVRDLEAKKKKKKKRKSTSKSKGRRSLLIRWYKFKVTPAAIIISQESSQAE